MGNNRQGIGAEGAARMMQKLPMGRRVLVATLAVAAMQLSGCAGLMMGGGGGYEPPEDTCTESQRRQGRCNSYEGG